MQEERRREPYPWSWEIPAGVLVATTALVVTSTQLARGAANLAAGGAWRVPPIPTWIDSTLPVLGGDAAAGLDVSQGPFAARAPLWIWVVAVHVILFAAVGSAAVAAWSRWGSGHVQGLASRAEVARLLTRRRLSRVRAVIRPDLVSKPRGRRREHKENPGKETRVLWR